MLGAAVRMTMPGPDGRIGHAELSIGDSVIMLADEFPDMGVHGPKSVGGTPVAIHVYVDDVDATFVKALGAGASTLRPVEDKFYGDRGGEFEDPFGHRWSIASHIEDLTPDEMERRMAHLPGQLRDAGLVDRLRLMTFPLIATCPVARPPLPARHRRTSTW